MVPETWSAQRFIRNVLYEAKCAVKPEKSTILSGRKDEIVRTLKVLRGKVVFCLKSLLTE